MRNVKKGGTYLPFRKEFMILMKICTYQEKQGTNVCGFCVMDSMFHFLNKNMYEEQKNRGNILMHMWFLLHFNSNTHLTYFTFFIFLKLRQTDLSK
jgi:hypothetical protein